MKHVIRNIRYCTTARATRCALLLGCATMPLWAAASFDSMTFKPATDQGSYLNVEQSQTLGQWGHALGITADYATRSLVLKNAAGTAIQDVVQRQLAVDIAGAIGLTDWLNFGIGFGGVPYQRFVTPGSGVQDNGARIGDIRLNLKAQFVDPEESAIGLAVVPFMTIPTGSDAHFTGNGTVTGGGLVVLDTKRLGERLSFAVNVGGEARKNVVLAPGATQIADQFIYGAAMNILVAKPLELIAEVRGKTPFNNFFVARDSQLEVDGAVRFGIGENHPFQITAGGGTGLQRGTGSPTIRAFTMLSYRFPVRASDPVVIPEEVISTNKIHFAFNKATIRPESFSVIDNILTGIQNRPAIERVRVEGHTDSVGSDQYNQSLSERRAAAVGTYLIQKNYPAEKLTTVGRGEGFPVTDNATLQGRAQNRRVEFHLQKQSGAKVRVEKQPDAASPTFESGDTPRNNRRSNTI